MNERQEIMEEMVRLEATLEQLARKRDGLTEYIDSHLALVSPARRLPNDILREIFNATLPLDGHLRMSGGSVSIANIELSALDAHLWASLHIDASKVSSDSFRLARLNEGLESWLPRSDPLPLSISFAGGYDSSESNLKSLLQTLMKFGEHIRLRLPSFSAFEPLKTLAPSHVPLLKAIAITADRDIDEDPHVFSFIGVTTLRGMSIDSYPGPGLQTSIPWQQLHHLSLGYISLPDALRLLQQCPNLETWRSRISDDTSDTVPTQAPISMENMHRIYIIDETFEETTELFEHTNFPNLHSLEYSHKNEDPTPIISSLCAPEKLTSLGLSAVISPDSLAECLRSLPMLRHLVLHRPLDSLQGNNVLTCELFALLGPSPPPSDAMLCTHLESICSLALDVGSDEELLSMVDARQPRNGVQRPLHVDVVFPRARQIPNPANLKTQAWSPKKEKRHGPTTRLSAAYAPSSWWHLQDTVDGGWLCAPGVGIVNIRVHNLCHNPKYFGVVKIECDYARIMDDYGLF
ncbi:hypothetical protein FB451DRAFT_1521061 [Mycena latifolia]|nr:hypothetical protein FB451DRAFT_1521061 [Mycena latifolia]